jgi:hypothetical protein
VWQYNTNIVIPSWVTTDTTTPANHVTGPNGLVQWRAAAVDAAGNQGAFSDPVSVKVDTEQPIVPGVSGGSDSWSRFPPVITPTFPHDGSGAVSGIDHYQYRVSTDGGESFGDPHSGYVFVANQVGSYEVEFAAVSGADVVGGYSDPSVAAAHANFDDSGPSKPTISGATGTDAWSTTQPVTLTASATDPSGIDPLGYHWEYRPHGTDTWLPLHDEDAQATDTMDGSFDFHVSATDTLMGNPASDYSDPVTVQIDTSAPAAPTDFSGGSLGWTNEADVQIQATAGVDADPGSGDAQTEWRFTSDGTNVIQSGTGTTADVTVDGRGWVQFRTTDVAGNHGDWAPGAATAATTVMRDTSAPSLGEVGGDLDGWTRQHANVTVTPSDGDGSGVDSVSYVADHYYLDTNGQEQVTTDWGDGMLDQEGHTFNWTPPTGHYLLHLQVSDLAGNTSDWTAVTSEYDPIAPSISGTSGGTSGWSGALSATPTPAVVDTSQSCSDQGCGSEETSGVAQMWVATASDGHDFGEWRQVQAWPTITAEGTTEERFRVVDGAGNTSDETTPGMSDIVQLDRHAPSITQVSGGSLDWSNDTVTITPSAVDNPALVDNSGVSHFEYRTSTDGGATWGPVQQLDNGDGAAISADGVTLVRFRAWDGAGNHSGWTTAGASSTAKVDTISPEVAITTELPQYVGGTVHVAGTATDGGSGVSSVDLDWNAHLATGTACQNVPVVNGQWSCDVDTTQLDDGAYQFAANAHDAAGNPGGSDPASTTVDNTGPDVSTPSYDAGWYTTASVDVSFATPTDPSGVASYVLERAEAPLTDGVCGQFSDLTAFSPTNGPTSVVDESVQSAHCYEYALESTDSVGNSSTSLPGDMAMVDLADPQASNLAASPSTPANWHVPVGLSVSASDTDGGGSISSVEFDYTTNDGPPASGIACEAMGSTSCNWDASALAMTPTRSVTITAMVTSSSGRQTTLPGITVSLPT